MKHRAEIISALQSIVREASRAQTVVDDMESIGECLDDIDDYLERAKRLVHSS